jgi:transposase
MYRTAAAPAWAVPPFIHNSPDLTPIELAFSKLKTILCKAAERTIPRLCRRTAFSAGECTNYFSHAGYVSR